MSKSSLTCVSDLNHQEEGSQRRKSGTKGKGRRKDLPDLFATISLFGSDLLQSAPSKERVVAHERSFW